ncbi:MAG: matrixin family metalloprotease [Planctomycetota bacterium]|nr:matrixin family metalloprotease [Planctomycetota bacterium]
MMRLNLLCYTRSLIARILSGPVPRRRRGPVVAAMVETLEQRQLLSSTSGPTWDNVSSLTISFAPDGTAVDGQINTLSAALGAVAPAPLWQQAILDAFQTWSGYSNINIGLVADGGQPFGTGGPTQGDTRFGDIRVAAIPMSADVLALSIPRSGAISGTWVGDVLFNSNAHFASVNDLYAVALHEAGHVFGLEHSSDPASPMYAHNNPGISKTLTATDIADLQQLYGVRTADLNDASRSNDTLKTATRIRGNDPTSGFTGATPLVAWGDITRPTDVDDFELAPFTGYSGAATIELRTAGISQLRADLSVFDQKGVLVARATAAAGSEKLAITLNPFDPNQRYSVRIAAAKTDLNGVGAYALDVKYDARLTTSEATLDAVARARYEFLSANDVQTLLMNAGQPLFNDDRHTDDTAGTGRAARSTPGFAEFTHYDAIASIADTTDVDYYRINTPKTAAGQPLIMTATVRGLQDGALLPRLSVVDSSGASVAADILANGLGVFTIQSSVLQPGKSYLVKVSSTTTSGPYATGNYAMQIRFGSTAVALTPFVSGSLDAANASQLFQLNVASAQLFQFVMAAGTTTTSEPVAVQMALFDSQGKLAYRLVGTPGEVRSAASTLLMPGVYFVQVSASTQSGTPVSKLKFDLLGSVLSEPIGPIPGDPTGAPPPAGTSGGPLGPKFTWQTGTTVAPPATISVTASSPWGALGPTNKLIYPWYWSFGLAGTL